MNMKILFRGSCCWLLRRTRGISLGFSNLRDEILESEAAVETVEVSSLDYDLIGSWLGFGIGI
jgi:hypothetical protein